jgi:hypothetical protein
MLSRDIWTLIISRYLPLKAVANLELTCQHFRNLINGMKYYEGRLTLIRTRQEEILAEHVPIKRRLANISTPRDWFAGKDRNAPHIQFAHRFNDFCETHQTICPDDACECEACGMFTCILTPTGFCPTCIVVVTCGCGRQLEKSLTKSCENCHLLQCEECGEKCLYGSYHCPCLPCDLCDKCSQCLSQFRSNSYSMTDCSKCGVEKCKRCFKTSVTGLKHREICGQCLDEKYGGTRGAAAEKP